MPGPIRSRMRIEAAAVLGALAIFLLAITLEGSGVIGRVPSPAIGLLFTLVGIVVVAGRRACGRTLRRAAAHDHLLCPQCTYDLRTLDATGACPECGRACEHDAVRRQCLGAQRRRRRKSRGRAGLCCAMMAGRGQPARDGTDGATALPPLLVRIRARVRRRLVAAALLGILLILAPVVPGMVPGVAFDVLRAYAIALFAGILACVAAAVAAMLADARRLAEASAAGDRLCPGCGYDPGPAAGAPACPECGGAYERAAARRQWAVARRERAGGVDGGGIDEPPA